MELDCPDPSLDGTLRVLADVRRRRLLRFLGEQPGNSAAVDELVRHLETRERATGGEQAPAPGQLEIELHHRHLPKLEQAGLVEYDLRSGRVRYYPDQTVEELLRFVRDLRQS